MDLLGVIGSFETLRGRGLLTILALSASLQLLHSLAVLRYSLHLEMSVF